MKNLLSYFLFFFFSSQLFAQTYCDSVFQVVPGSVRFYDSQFSGGDSVLQLSLVNISAGQSLAYPTAKFIPLTPLPPGMTLSLASVSFNTVFASSYVPGDTSQVSFYFSVSQAIPDNYSVWFQLWADGDNSSTLIDSCQVQDSFLVNLKPVNPLSVSNQLEATNGIEFRQVEEEVLIRLIHSPGSIRIYDVMGRKMQDLQVDSEDWIAVKSLLPGVYIFRLDSGQSIRYRIE
jgi:hypothetical protein